MVTGTPQHLEAIHAAIKVAEDYANGGSGDPNEAYNAALAYGTRPREPEGLESNSACEVSRADESTAAARAAGYAARTGSSYDPDVPTYAAAAAAEARAAAGNGAIFVNALFADFQGLVALGLPHFPEEGPSVDPSDSGPLGLLWPHTVPTWVSRDGNLENQIRRLLPASNLPDDSCAGTWAIVLSDWPQHSREELLRQLERLFEQQDEKVPIPTVLVLDDGGGTQTEHQSFLKDLTCAGGIILVPESEEELAMVRNAPLAFAAKQFMAAAQSLPVGTASLSPAGPSSPDAYKDFGKAVTRLSPVTLQELIEGQRTDDWRYSS